MDRIPKLPLINLGFVRTGRQDDKLDGQSRAKWLLLLPIVLRLCFLALKIEAKSYQNGTSIQLVVNKTTHYDISMVLIFNSSSYVFVTHFGKVKLIKTVWKMVRYE